MNDGASVTPVPLLVQVSELVERLLGELEERLRDDLRTEVAELHARIDAVHERALRELTRLTARGNDS